MKAFKYLGFLFENLTALYEVLKFGVERWRDWTIIIIKNALQIANIQMISGFQRLPTSVYGLDFGNDYFRLSVSLARKRQCPPLEGESFSMTESLTGFFLPAASPASF